VRFSFYGHVHHEDYGTVRSFSSDKPVGIQYWTGSVSTWSAINPSFRVFEVDAETMLPVKAHTYVLNVADANPEWKWDHELTEYYNMVDLSPLSFDALADSILNDEELALKYAHTKTQFGPETNLQ